MACETWIGLIEVQPEGDSSILPDSRGAWTHVLANATDEDDFKAQIGEWLGFVGLGMVKLRDAEPLRTWLLKSELEPGLKAMADGIGDEPGPVLFGEFQPFPTKDELQ